MEEAYDKDKFHDKVIVNIEGADHFEDIDTGKRRAIQYAMKFLECYLRGNEKACGYVFGNEKDSLCKNQRFHKARCEALRK